jgi:hypothetical protein
MVAIEAAIGDGRLRKSRLKGMLSISVERQGQVNLQRLYVALADAAENRRVHSARDAADGCPANKEKSRQSAVAPNHPGR